MGFRRKLVRKVRRKNQRQHHNCTLNDSMEHYHFSGCASAQDTNVASWLHTHRVFSRCFHSHKMHTILGMNRFQLQKFCSRTFFHSIPISIPMKFTWKWVHSFDDSHEMGPNKSAGLHTFAVTHLKMVRSASLIFAFYLANEPNSNWTYFKCREIWISNENLFSSTKHFLVVEISFSWEYKLFGAKMYLTKVLMTFHEMCADRNSYNNHCVPFR